MDPQAIERVSGLVGAAMGDPTRLKIVLLLSERGELPSGAIQEAVGRSWSLTSAHLNYLRRYGVVQSRKEGQRVLYRLVDPKLGRLVNAAVRDAARLLEGG